MFRGKLTYESNQAVNCHIIRDPSRSRRSVSEAQLEYPRAAKRSRIRSKCTDDAFKAEMESSVNVEMEIDSKVIDSEVYSNISDAQIFDGRRSVVQCTKCANVVGSYCRGTYLFCDVLPSC